MAYKLFLDDKRSPPSGEWVVARSYAEFRDVTKKRGMPEMVSFDYDLTDDYTDTSTKTGLACARWMMREVAMTGARCPDFKVHSQNHRGAAMIRSEMEAFYNNWNR